MGVRESIYSRCTTHSGLSDLIGARCYPQMLPNEVQLPAVVYNFISTPPHGYSDHDASPPDRWRSRVQFDAYAETSDGVHEVGEELFDAWEGYHSGTAVGWARVTNRTDAFEPGLNRYRYMVEIEIDHAV